MDERIRHALREGRGLLTTTGHRELRHPVGAAVRRGELVSLLPRVYTEPEHDLPLRARAVLAADPNAVLTGLVAARLWWWPEAKVSSVTAASRLKTRPGFRFTTESVPETFIGAGSGLRLTTPAYTAMDLAATMGGAPIDRVLRSRKATLADMWHVLESTPHRPGNAERRRLLLDSRDEPWSEAERGAHRCLRASPLGSFVTNYRVRTPSGVAYLDIAFPGLKLGIEIDGYEYHRDREAFERDRWRDAALAARGWQIVRFPASALDHPERFLSMVTALVAARAAACGR